jgi:uncharacterized membrane protein YdjX (TVP38/TMEM64 family)
MENGTPSRRARSTIARLLPILLITAAGVLVFVLGWDRYLSFEALSDNRERLLAWRDSHFIVFCLMFMLVYAVVIALSVPGGVWLTIAGGFVFGAAVSTALVVVAATAGACGIFLAARYAFSKPLRARMGPSIKRMEDGFRDNAFSYLLVLRLIPIFPFWLVNLVPAFLGVPLRTYAAGTFIGIVPGSFVYSLVGSGLGAVFDAGQKPDLNIIFQPQVLAPLIGLALLAMLPVAYKHLRRRRTVATNDAPFPPPKGDDE